MPWATACVSVAPLLNTVCDLYHTLHGVRCPVILTGPLVYKKCIKIRFTIRIYVHIAMNRILMLPYIQLAYFCFKFWEKDDKKRTYSKDLARFGPLQLSLLWNRTAFYEEAKWCKNIAKIPHTLLKLRTYVCTRTCVTAKACAVFWRCFRTIWLRK